VFPHEGSPNQITSLGGNMADKEFNSGALYRLVIVLNGTLKVLVTRLEDLAEAKILSPEYIEEIRRLTDKIESEIGPK
jgi:hypothetical protein